MELYIIRHGQCVNNANGEDLSKRHKDAPLTDLGHRQAEIVARHLAGSDYAETAFSYHSSQGERPHYGLTRLYCSAMHRALQTARPIGAALNIMPEVWVDIHEHGGIYLQDTDGKYTGYPGLTRREIAAEFAGYVLPEAVTDEGWWNRDAESHMALYDRALRVADQLNAWAREGSKERIGIVTHGMFIDMLIKTLLDQIPNNRVYYHHYNTAITRIDMSRHGDIDIRFVNRIAHLSPDMVSA